MADHIYNQVGSTSVKPPKVIAVGDTLRFNITNTDKETKHKGTLLTYTFPFDCRVKIDAVGARGGVGNKANITFAGKGARVAGVRSFKQGDTLLVLVGQAGTDVSGSLGDGVGGAGGGGTFVTLKVDTGGDEYRGAGVGNGWQVKPLLVSAGGCGSTDFGEVPNAKAIDGNENSADPPAYKDNYRNGNGYFNSGKTDGASSGFLHGGFGSSKQSFRDDQVSYSGFGCGGGNADIGRSGGGGYYGGQYQPGADIDESQRASSFVAVDMEGVERQRGAGVDEGYVTITFLDVPDIELPTLSSEVYAKMNGVWIQVI